MEHSESGEVLASGDTRTLIDVPHLPEYDADFPRGDAECVVSKSQTIMHAKQYNKYADVFFQSGLDEDPRDFSPSHYHEHRMSVDMWEEMGRPMTITVTIEPGDLLNDEATEPTERSQGS